jgi:hypothetical protein
VGQFDGWTLGGPSALFDDGQLRLYYFGNSASDSFTAGFGRASAACLP